jgi:hypothetical protein
MKTNMLIRVRKHFDNPLSPRHTNRHNMRQWIRSVRFLGDKWLLAVPVLRKELQ